MYTARPTAYLAARMQPEGTPPLRWTLALTVALTPALSAARTPAQPVPTDSSGPAFATPAQPTPPAPVPAASPEQPVPSASSAQPAPAASPAPPVPSASPAQPVPSASPAATGPSGPLVRRRAPRSIGLWAGYAWNPVNYLPMRADGKLVKPHGASLLFDYGWQVGGLQPGGWPTYVGFLAGVNYYPGADERRHLMTIEYGLLVRHHLAPRWKVHPFLAYGLGAIQAFVFGVHGRGIGHLTRLSVGLEGSVTPKVRLALELIYKLDPIRGYRLGDAAENPKFDIHTLSALFGVNFSL